MTLLLEISHEKEEEKEGDRVGGGGGLQFI